MKKITIGQDQTWAQVKKMIWEDDIFDTSKIQEKAAELAAEMVQRKCEVELKQNLDIELDECRLIEGDYTEKLIVEFLAMYAADGLEQELPSNIKEGK